MSVGRHETDRERCLRLEARVAELEEELREYRAAGTPADPDYLARVAAATRAFRPLLKGSYSGHSPQAARALIYLLRHPDALQSHGRIGEAVALSEVENPVALGRVSVAWLRHGLEKLGLSDVICAVYGEGVFITRGGVERVKAALGLDHA